MIPLFKVHMPESVMEPLKRTLLSGYIGQGLRVVEFELGLKSWTGDRRPLAVNSGTSAIHLALRLAGVGHGDRVISTPMTCAATNMPILERGAEIVWADIDPRTGNIDVEDVEDIMGGDIKAIVCVDWGGYPCDLDELGRIAAKHGAVVIEDAAHAFGASYHGRRVGSNVNFTTFSFQAIKHITTGDGGALTCRNPLDRARGKLLRWYGIDRDQPRDDMRCEQDIVEYGYKFHMNDIAAAIGIEQLEHAESILAKHQSNGQFYRLELQGLRGVKLLEYQADRASAYWLSTILVEDPVAFRKFMAARGVMASQVHVRNDKHTAFKASGGCELPGVDEFTARQISIPTGWWLTPDERRRIAEAVREWSRARA